MSKRKLDGDADTSGSSDAKEPRRGGAGAAAAGGEGSSSGADAALGQSHHASRVATQTLGEVLDRRGDYARRMQTVVQLLTEDAAQPEPLINLSLMCVVEDHEVGSTRHVGRRSTAWLLSSLGTSTYSCLFLLLSVSVLDSALLL